jgi:hypothetical protein
LKFTVGYGDKMMANLLESPRQDKQSRLPQIDGPQARVLAFKPFEKNTLRGFFHLELPTGMILAGCTLHEKHAKYWVGLPGRPYTAADGSQAWSKIVDFRDARTRNKFQEEVTPLACVAYEHHASAGQ